jgi:hypothetical protein
MQVQKHREKVQQEKEDAAVEKLASLMPQMGGMVRALALTKTNWDVESALSMLRQFQVACLDKLNAVTKVRGTDASHQQLLFLTLPPLPSEMQPANSSKRMHHATHMHDITAAMEVVAGLPLPHHAPSSTSSIGSMQHVLALIRDASLCPAEAQAHQRGAGE